VSDALSPEEHAQALAKLSEPGAPFRDDVTGRVREAISKVDGIAAALDKASDLIAAGEHEANAIHVSCGEHFQLYQRAGLPWPESRPLNVFDRLARLLKALKEARELLS